MSLIALESMFDLGLITGFLLDTPVLLGVLFFALSRFYRRPLVVLPVSSKRTGMLVVFGVAGSLLVVLVTLLATAVAAAGRWDETGVAGWWIRPAPLAAAGLVVLIAWLAYSREPLPIAGERAIAPRPRWHAFAPQPALWVGAIAAGLLGATTVWQGLRGVPLPVEGRTDPNRDQPIWQAVNNGTGYFPGAGWPNHLATLLVLLISCAALVCALRQDANRPIPKRGAAATARYERVSTGHMYTFVLLGGMLITLGLVWMHTGYLGGGLVVLGETPKHGGDIPREQIVTSDYAAIAQWLRQGGRVLQGIGAALLLRLAADT